jgi:hypothetical protein
MAISPKQSSGRSNNALVFVLYANAALLLCILIVLMSRGNSTTSIIPAAWGQEGPAGIGGGDGIFVMPAQFSGNTWGCYLMDVRAQTLCAYQYTPGDRQLHFIAARNFKYDRELGDYNTAPSPRDVADLVRRENLPPPATQPTKTP